MTDLAKNKEFGGGGGSGAIANVGSVDPSEQINVTFIPINYLSAATLATQIGSTYSFFPANTSATSTASLANAFSFIAYSTYPIASIVVNNGGGGYKTDPAVSAEIGRAHV